MQTHIVFLITNSWDRCNMKKSSKKCDYLDRESLIEFLNEDMKRADFWATVSLIAAGCSVFFAVANIMRLILWS